MGNLQFTGAAAPGERGVRLSPGWIISSGAGGSPGGAAHANGQRDASAWTLGSDAYALVPQAVLGQLTGPLSGSGALAVSGAGTLTLSGANTYAGGTSVNGASLILNSNSAAGTGPVTLADGAALTANGLSDAYPLRNTLVVASAASGALPCTITGTAQNGEIDGNLILNGPAVLAVDYAGGGGFYFNYNRQGTISGNPGTLTLRALQGGQLYLGGNNSFSGAVQIPQGGIMTFHANALAGNLIVMSGTARLTLYSAPLIVGDLAGGAANTVSLGSFMLTLGGPAGASFDGVITGTGAVMKNGPGTQNLAGANTWSGSLTVNFGALVVSGSIASRTWIIAVDSVPDASNSGQLAFTASVPALTGVTIDILLTESGTGLNWKAVSWTGTPTGSPALQVNGAPVASGVPTPAGTTVVCSSSGISVIR